ncbi:MAG: helix-turn-helix transcriptional regulator [Candidatus Cryptobacteroides sp.]
MNNRLQQFLAAENISRSQFADTINVARASVSHILAGRNKPGWDFITSMMKHYPNLNIEWLLNGTGKMYKTASDVKVSQEKEEDESIQDNLFSFGSPVQEKPVHPRREDKIPATGADSAEIPRPQEGKIPVSPLQVIDNQRKISKIVVFYDDNTFIEIK